VHADLLVNGLGYAWLPFAREASLAALAVAGVGTGTVLVAASEWAAI
jgi:hypothetical protein